MTIYNIVHRVKLLPIYAGNHFIISTPNSVLFHFQFYSEAIIQGQATMEWTR